MQKTVIIALAVVGALTAGFFLFRNKPTPSTDALKASYNQWKLDHSINVGAAEDDFRFKVWTKNYAFYNASNAKNLTYTLGLNSFSHLTREEFAATHLGYKKSATPSPRNETELPANLQATVDWRSKLNPIKNQGQCGSCWAFSAVGAVEAINSIKGVGLFNLAEQELVDCGSATGNQGCNGGLMDYAFKYVIQKKGLALTSEYPYTAVDGTCKTVATRKGAIKSYTDVKASNPTALKAAIAQQPVSVAIEADTQTFQGYTSGVITGSACGTNLDHGVIAVGYNDSDKTPYYIVRNSWGASWGLSGYVNIGISNGAGVCGIQLDPSYPTL